MAAPTLKGFGVPPLPQLDAFGIAVTDAGALCETNTFSCLERPHAAHVAIGADSADLSWGTTQIGWLSFTNASFLQEKDTGFCDTKGNTLMAGFRTP